MSDMPEIPAFLRRVPKQPKRTNPRKGLKREGWRRYRIGDYAIDREAARRFEVRPASFPRAAGFFCQEFRRLRDARAYAEQEAGQG